MGWQRHDGDQCFGHGQARKSRVVLQGEVDGVGKVDVPGFRVPVDGCRPVWVSVRDEAWTPDRAAVKAGNDCGASSAGLPDE